MANTIISSYQSSYVTYMHILSPWSEQLVIELQEHTQYELFFLIQGNVIYFVNGNQYMLAPGDALCISKFEMHSPQVLPSEYYERVYIHFFPEYMSDYPNMISPLMKVFHNRTAGSYNLFHLDHPPANAIPAMLRDLEAAILSKASDRMLYIFMQILFLMNISYIDTLSSAPVNKASNNTKIPDLIAYIEDNYMENISLQELSNKFFISKYHICHIFKKYTGFSLINYVNFKRVTKATYLMAHNVPITDVCYEVGFRNYSNFYKSFKKYTGVGPKDYYKTTL